MTFSTKQDRSVRTIQHQAYFGLGLMLAAALIFSFLGVFIKMLSPRFRIWDIAAYRFLGGLLGLLVLFGRRENFFRPQNPKLMLTRGIIGSAAFICLVIAIRNIPFSTAMVFFYSFPAFAAFFSGRLFGEKASNREWACIALTISGVAVIFDFKLSGGLYGQVFGVLAGLLAGLTTSLIKKLRETNGSAIIYFYMCLCGGLITLPFFAQNPQFPYTPDEWLFIVGIILTSTSAQLLMTQGFKYCKSWEGGVFMTSEVIFAIVLGVALFYEQLTWQFLTGGMMVIASAFAIQSKARR